MAKKVENNEISDEVLKRQKEREEREKKEKEEQKKRDQEKLQKKKEREARIKKKEKKEKQRINRTINYPFKTLFQTSSLFGIFTFVITFFWSGNDVLKSLLYTFFVFSLIFLLVGFILLVIYYIRAEEKLQELELQKQQQIENEKIEEEKRLAASAKLEKEIKEHVLSSNTSTTEKDYTNIQEPEMMNSDDENNDFELSFQDKIKQNQMEDEFMERKFDENFQDFEETMGQDEFFK